ncbi:cobalt/nickel transport system ATP-binding protein [Acetoanaerobium pronyense]|uniref:ABC transporter ATP-binding protein n=1 Tax=Acetoanaerobium pronyense TaxID=1482736 RepID=A0ABS4KG55_9FIRM|nr:ATP-binding cassette domain-containing protein [Acetoanaerobium pronyense]MBP2026750.1 cobalt/nickel transport system ATP-binding protein [Acetoanaerobium pronyense]
MNAIEVKNLYYEYKNKILALDDINMKIEIGKKTIILGANGSGKSTLLQHFNGLNKAQRGEVLLHGQNIKKSKDSRKLVGIVFDNPDDQIFSSSVYDDVAFGPRNQGLTEGEVSTKVNETLEILSLLEFKDRAPYHLSLGQKKRVAIAGVLAMEPDIMILDEPFSGLDAFTIESFMELLDTLHKKGKTIVIATHDLNLVWEWGDSFIIMNNGKIIKKGDSDIFYDNNLLQSAKLRQPYKIQYLQNRD